MVVRISFSKMDNPFMTTRMLLKLFKCKRAIVKTEDIAGDTVIMVESRNEFELAKKIRNIDGVILSEVLPDEFDQMVEKLKKPIQEKKIFITSIDDI